MTRVRANTTTALLLAVGLLYGCGDSDGGTDATPSETSGDTAGDTTAPGAFSLEEASVARLQHAFAQGSLTSHDLTARYLQRIARFDPELHAVLAINTGALARAAELDQHYAQTGELVGPLHGIPILLKDNLDMKLPRRRRPAPLSWTRHAADSCCVNESASGSMPRASTLWST